jgi:hypothetical protein
VNAPVTAFWFWLILARVLGRLSVPYPTIVAAVLGWVAAGLLVT